MPSVTVVRVVRVVSVCVCVCVQVVEVLRYGLCESPGVQSQHIFTAATELVGSLLESSPLESAVTGAGVLLAGIAGRLLDQEERVSE